MLRHPGAIVALVVLVLNDHILKSAMPGLLTGKLSDVAGLIVFPLLLAEAVLAGTRLVGRRPVVAPVAVVAWCAGVTTLGFALVKTLAPATAAWAWAWGAVQWLAGAGPLTGRPLLLVAVVRDPTDLLALPAVLVAVAIAARTRRQALARPRAATPRRQRSWTGAAMGLVTAVACMATSQSEPAVYADTEAHVTLTAGTPVIVRHVTWSLDMATSRAGTVELTTRVEEDAVGEDAVGDPNWPLPPVVGVLISLIPDDGSSGLESPSDVVDWGPTTRVVTAGGCQGWCSGGARLVLRLASPSKAVDDPMPLLLTAAVRATGLGGPAPSAATVTVRIDPDSSLDGSPSLSRDVAKGTMHLTPKSDEQVAHLTVKVSKEALDEPLAWPLVLRLFVTVDPAYSGAAEDGQYAYVAIDGRDEGIDVPIGTPLDLDLLGACDANRTCGIPVKLWLGWNVRGGADVHWTVEARLEAFDGRVLPDEAVQVTVHKP
ncbi:MAG: hypothetical protein WCK58_13170 [Chloroflexota bacterium]